jgi:glucose-6-phosphate isomerase
MDGLINTQTMMLDGATEERVHSALARMAEENWVGRIWEPDPNLWRPEPHHHKEIRNRLGWLHLPTRNMSKIDMLRSFADDIRGDFDRVVLLGMGGSSLGAECFANIFGSAEGYPQLGVLDSTVPAEVLRATGDTDINRCLFIVASKSGTTTEALAFYRYFLGKVQSLLGAASGEHFIAITDPDTELGQIGREAGFRAIFENWQDIGGRYSALSYFGMVPAALMGLPLRQILQGAAGMAEVCSPAVPVDDNPGAALGALLGVCHEMGRDKVTFLTSDRLATFGDWAEQLLAESTGKEGKGLIPVVAEPPVEASAYGSDRLFVQLRINGDAIHDKMVDELAQAGHPVVRMVLDDVNSIGAEMFRWEFATAVAGAMMQINPFDQPDVGSAKAKTREMLDHYEQEGALPECEADVVEGSIFGGDVRGAVNRLIDDAHPGEYLAIMAYLPQSEVVEDAVARMRTEVAARGVATTFGYGPRFLHSTGQLHKGGPKAGVFLQLVADDPRDAEIPGEPYSFSTLRQAQADGDLTVLNERGLEVMRVDLGDDIPGNIGRLTEMIIEAVAY